MTAAGLLILVVLALLGIPLFAAIIACGLLIMVIGLDIEPYQPLSVMFSRVSSYNLLAIPLFVYLGQILSTGEAGKSLVKLLNSFMGHIPGGPAYALIFASVLIAAMCAHPLAAIAGFGPLMIPIMVSLGYSEVFAVGLLLAAASLAPLIPPSTMAIMFALIANPVSETSVDITTIWTASIIPGIVIALLLCLVVFFYSTRGHFKRLPAASWGERWGALKEAWPVALTPFAVLGPLYLNWANPTEVAALGCIYVMLISRFFYSGMTWRSLWAANISTLRVLGAIFLIIMAAFLLTNVIVRAQVPQDITNWIANMGLSWWSFMIMLMVLYIIMGMFLDPSAIILVAVPMIIGPAEDLGINVYVFGVFTMVAVTMAGMTPPYGLTIFATQGILGKPYHFVVKACIMFLPALVLGLIIIAFIPQLTTWLPDLLDYK